MSSPQNFVNNMQPREEWHYVKRGDLPPPHPNLPHRSIDVFVANSSGKIDFAFLKFVPEGEQGEPTWYYRSDPKKVFRFVERWMHLTHSHGWNR